MEKRIPKPGEKYIHFKQKAYQIICVASHSETGEKMVVYQALYGEFLFYVRPLSMFVSEVDHQKYPDVKQKYRFELAEDIKQNAPEDEEAKDLNINLHHIRIMDLNGEEHAPLQEELMETEGIAAKTPLVSQQSKSVVPAMSNPEPVKQEPTGSGANAVLLEFLDADTYEEKRKVLRSIRDSITDRLVDDFAVALDVVIPEGNIDNRYQQLDACLRTMQRYETERLR